jgi:hydrogenase-1 operon protein HyaF
MKAGFWVAPEGEDAAVTIMPIGIDDDYAGRTSTGTVSFLATAGAEEIIARCPHAAKLLPEIAQALRIQKADQVGQLFDLTELGTEEQELIGQVLGNGEVSGVVALTDGIVAQIQEAVMPGVWRVRFTDQSGALVGDYIEVASIPGVVTKAAALTAETIHWGDEPEGAMNVMPVLTEIKDRMATHKPGDDSHTISFTLLPMNEVDMEFLQKALGDGPVHLLSKGYGTCRVLSTGARNVWSVQFFNSMDTIILDTLEIGDVPMAARAADDDFEDSATRIKEIYEAYFL